MQLFDKPLIWFEFTGPLKSKAWKQAPKKEPGCLEILYSHTHRQKHTDTCMSVYIYLSIIYIYNCIWNI